MKKSILLTTLIAAGLAYGEDQKPTQPLFNQQILPKTDAGQNSDKSAAPSANQAKPAAESPAPASDQAAVAEGQNSDKPAEPSANQEKPAAESPAPAEKEKPQDKKIIVPLQEQLQAIETQQSAHLAAFDDASSEQISHASQQLLTELKKSQENAVVSGVGAVMLLKAIAAGAEGESHTQIADWLGGEVSVDGIATLLSAQDQNLTQAAAMLIPKAQFQAILPSFRTEMEQQGFILVDDLKALNEKVRTTTKGKIPTALKQLPANTRLVLTHALHFAAPWKMRFSEVATKNLPFLALDKEGKKITVDVPTMHNGMLPLSWIKEGDTLGVRLPFENGYSLLIAMPMTDKPSLSALDQAAQWLETHKKALFRQNAHDSNFYMPRWSLKQSHNFIEPLKQEKVTDIFNPNTANLKRMSDEKDLYISVFKQEIYIDINEKGGEAAAVTTAVAVVRSVSVKPDAPPEIKIDRPFVYAIVADQTGVEVLKGYLQNPTAK